jgi:hypothetical protein
MTDDKTSRGFFRDYFIPILTTATAVLSTILVFRVQNLNAKTDQAIRTLEEQRLARESDVNLTFKVYDAVKVSLDASNARQQQVALALVNSLLPEGDLRTSLLKVLGETATPEVKEEANVAVFNSEEQQLAQTLQKTMEKPASDLKSFRFDIFWCETSGDVARQRAEQVKAQMLAEGWGTAGTVRVRPLPQRINDQSGYKAQGWQIRWDGAEQPQAEQWHKVINNAMGKNVNVELVPAHNTTRNYMSCFICISPQ